MTQSLVEHVMVNYGEKIESVFLTADKLEIELKKGSTLFEAVIVSSDLLCVLRPIKMDLLLGDPITIQLTLDL